MRSILFDPRHIFARLGWASWPRFGPSVVASVRLVLRWAAHHSGLPVVLVAAIGLVLSWRIIRRTLRLAVEVVIALAALAVATRLGWLTW
jgi:hypothetical protein